MTYNITARNSVGQFMSHNSLLGAVIVSVGKAIVVSVVLKAGGYGADFAMSKLYKLVQERKAKNAQTSSLEVA